MIKMIKLLNCELQLQSAVNVNLNDLQAFAGNVIT